MRPRPGWRSTRRLTRGAWWLAALALAALVLQGGLLWRDQRANAAIAAGQPPADGDQAELRFARAHALATQAESRTRPQADANRQLDAALNAYRALHLDPVVGQAARFNAANLLLRQAIQVRAGNQPGQALALIELAKENYRELLRHDPGHWDARYNLERAQRLAPDPEDAELDTTGAQRERERAATTMRAQSLGLP